jgi:hypothetical protein
MAAAGRQTSGAFRLVVCSVGVVHRTDALTGTAVQGQRCVTWAWRTSPSGA